MFDFNNVEAATEKPRRNYLKPGMYELKMAEVEYFESSQKKTPGFKVGFQCKSDNPEYNEKWVESKIYVTPATLSRIQYLHKGLFGVPIQKSFEGSSSPEKDIVNYFTSLLPKAKFVKMVVGGSINKNKLYSDLPYLGFFPTEEEYEEGPFPLNGELFQSVITSDVKVIKEEAESGNTSSSDIDMFEDSPFGE